MSTQKLNRKKIKEEFQALFEQSPEEKIEHRAQMLSYIFLSEAERALEQKGWTQKRLATEIGISASFLTQLFRGDRLMNFKTVAKIEQALGLEYHILETTNKTKTKEYARFFINQEEPKKNTAKVGSPNYDEKKYRTFSACTVHELRAA